MNSEAIQNHKEMLQTYRVRLRILIAGQQFLGASVPPHIVEEVDNLRKCIQISKNTLRLLGEDVNNHPDDDAVIQGRMIFPPIVIQANPLCDSIPLPPEFGEYLLWYLPKEMREEIIGDLAEDYHTLYIGFGRRRAVIWYYCQVGASFWPFAARKVQKLFKWGVFGWVGDLIRRIIT